MTALAQSSDLEGRVRLRTRSKTIALGGGALAVGQGLSSTAQIFYSSLTSRIFAPESFGAFAIAMSLVGLVAILLTTGLPSYILATARLEASASASVVSLAVLGGIAGAAAVVGLSSVWAALWRSPESLQFAWPLSAYVLIMAPASVQLALLRREGRPLMDAVVQAAAALIGMALGATAALVFRAPVSLVVAPIVTSIATFVGAYFLRRTRRRFQRPAAIGDIMRFARKVSQQNLVFFTFSSSPVWVVSYASDQQTLGYFVRASLLTTMASLALVGALSRAVQPQLRHVTPQLIGTALRDLIIVSASLSLPLFLGISVMAPRIVEVWLGQNWGPTGKLMAVLAIGSGVFVIYSVLAGALEMLSRFRWIRWSQLAMSVPGVALLGTTVATGDVRYAAISWLAMGLAGLASLVFMLSVQALVPWRQTIRGLLNQVLCAVVVALGMWGVVSALDIAGAPSAVALGAAVVGGSVIWLGTIPYQAAYMVLVRRGVLGKRRSRGRTESL